VVLDNLSAHKVPGIREAIEAVGAKLLYLPPYSPDFNPIVSSSSAQSSKPCHERRSVSGAASHVFSMPSIQRNAPITSATPDMLQML
jgi:hypothetical protein